MAKIPLRADDWQDWPDEVPPINPWRLYRIPHGGKTAVRIVSPSIMWRCVHFFGGRSQPHITDGRCLACEKNNQARDYGWYAAVLEKTQEKVICEATHRSSGYFRQAYQTYGSLTGLRAVQMRIPPEKKTGRLHVLLHRVDDGMILPPAPDVRLIMERMWAARRPLSDDATAEQRLMDDAARRRAEQ